MAESDVLVGGTPQMAGLILHPPSPHQCAGKHLIVSGQVAICCLGSYSPELFGLRRSYDSRPYNIQQYNTSNVFHSICFLGDFNKTVLNTHRTRFCAKLVSLDNHTLLEDKKDDTDQGFFHLLTLHTLRDSESKNDV